MDASNELQIRNLIARVAHLTDNWCSETDYVNEYTEDCEWHLEGLEPYRGREGLVRRLREMLAAGICGPGLPTRHCVTSLEVVPAPNDVHKATANSFVIMMTMKEHRPQVEGYGEYHDTVICSGGRWRIARRYGIAFWK